MSIDSSGSSFLTNQNAGIIGMPSEFSELNLPSYRDVLKFYFFLSDREREKSKKQHSYTKFSSIIANKIIEIWEKINIALINKKSVLKKLNTFLNKYHKEVKNISRGNTFSEFETSLNDVFNIGKCSCKKTVEPIIMDKSKVGREKIKSRESVRRMQNDDSALLAFSFNGRKNDALTREEISGKYHPRVEKE